MEKSNRQWLLLRGLTRGQFHWGDFPQRLQSKFPKDEIILLDLPGNGYRYSEKSPFSVREYTEDLRAKFQNKGELHIIAFSFGAMVAVDWLVCFPSEIAKAYLVNTSSKGLLPFYKRLLPKNYLKIFQTLWLSKYQREKMILEMTSNNLESQRNSILKFEKFAELYPVTIKNLYRQLVASGNFVFPESIEKEKIELFVSSNDRLVSSENTLALAKKWNLNPIVHPWAGHDLVLDDPEFVLSNLNPSTVG